MHVAIVGNSGSGKTTLAHDLSGDERVSVLDLDTVAWESDQIAVARPVEAARKDVRAFRKAHDSWIIEGCYAGLIEEYYSRDDDISLAGHKTLFENYTGPKQWLSTLRQSGFILGEEH